MDASSIKQDSIDAQRAYADVIAAARTKPFAWGEHDCATFACSAVMAMHGRDLLSDAKLIGKDGRVKWSDAKSAAKKIKAIGGLSEQLTKLLGDQIPVMLARTGDVCLVLDDAHESSEMMALVHGTVILAAANYGLAVLPLSAAVFAWSTR